MLEKENALLSFNCQDEIVTANTMVRLVQMLLNEAYGEDKFRVYYESHITDRERDKIPVMMKSRIYRYSIRKTKTVLMNVSLSIKASVEEEEEKIKVYNTVDKLCGNIDFTTKVVSNGELVDYVGYAGFERQEGASNPENINATWTQTIRLRGNIQMSQVEGGAILSDRVLTYILLKDENGIEHEHYVCLKSSAEVLNYSTETPQRMNNFDVETDYVSNAQIKTFTILYCNDKIGNLIRDYAKGNFNESNNPFLDEEGNPVMKIKEHYPDKDITTTYYVTSVQENREMGTVMAFNVSLTQTPRSSVEPSESVEQE